MLICKGEQSYKCSEFERFSIMGTQGLIFSILDPISPNDVANLFEDNTFYFYDELLKGKLPDTNNKKIVGLNITYNADSTCNIKIKLTKGDVDNEN